MTTSLGPAFVKLEATGNDFVVIDDPLLFSGGSTPTLPAALRILLCDRHRGVGADGVLTILPSRDDVHALVDGRRQSARFRMHITNPDGSIPEMCGNGLRCVARHLAETGRIPVEQQVVIDTDAGARTVIVAATFDHVTIDMGLADFLSPRQFTPSLLRVPFDVEGLKNVPATTVSMGNPHLVLEVATLPDCATSARMGRQLELDSARFPQRTNIEWVVDSVVGSVVGSAGADRGPGDVDVIVWERGAGLTQACGTGACAVVAALVRAGRRQPGTTTCHLPGGPLAITVSSLQAPIFMRGPVERVFSGVFSRLR